MASQEKGYVDTTYLDAVQALLSALKRLTYEDMHLQPGQVVLDVGSGPGTDTIPLASLVGPSGRVVGVDHDPRMVAEAERRAVQAGVANVVAHQQADAAALPFAAGSFDACRCERLLEHLRDPAAALAEMARVTTSGGWIVALDTDWGSLSIDAPDTEAERRHVRFFTEHLLVNGYSGRQLPRLFRQQGVRRITTQVHGVAFTDYSVARLTMLMDRWEREALASGTMSPEELERLRRYWEQADEEGAFFASVSMVRVSGRKP